MSAATWSVDLTTQGDSSAGWVPGSAHRDAALRERLRAKTLALQFVFPERYHAPSIEAHRLLTGKHLGLPIHFLYKVRAHPARLRGAAAWLDEPVLNRLACVVWMMGSVVDARVLTATTGDAVTRIVALRHAHPGRLSLLELVVSPGVTHAGTPAVRERFEATGSDGFLRVNGVTEVDRGAPRIEVHRGAAEIVQRDLSREPAGIDRLADAYRDRDRVRGCALTRDYLDACEKADAAETA